MKPTIRAITTKVLGLSSWPLPYLLPDKKELIDFACQRLNMRSFADLGGIWNVDGGYTFYGMEQHSIKDAVLVDTDLVQAVLERQRRHPGLRIIQGNFGDRSIVDQIGKVDGAIFFDTLLHQVKPNWDEILQAYSRVADILLIFNPQYTRLQKTTRLLDLGHDEYFRNVPHLPSDEPYKTCFQNLDAIHPKHGRPYPDIHNIWQWGIVDADLISLGNDLGFRMQFFKNCGQFGRLKNVENHAFVFSKSPAKAPH
jgi:hypothetical protein